MYDRRIIRGNTYALHSLPAVSALCWTSTCPALGLWWCGNEV